MKKEIKNETEKWKILKEFLMQDKRSWQYIFDGTLCDTSLGDFYIPSWGCAFEIYTEEEAREKAELNCRRWLIYLQPQKIIDNSTILKNAPAQYIDDIILILNNLHYIGALSANKFIECLLDNPDKVIKEAVEEMGVDYFIEGDWDAKYKGYHIYCTHDVEIMGKR